MTNANLKLTLIAIVTGGVFLLTQPAPAGGPVIVEDTAVDAAEPRSGAAVPIILGLIILCAIACDSDGGPDVKPGPVCREGC
jgi:hypothetical protein